MTKKRTIRGCSVSKLNYATKPIGGAIVANMLIPGFGAAVAGGVLGALLGSESAKKENSDD
ncbi:hypothetical protein ACFFUS_22325 [Vibrio gallaecicus]|uniref:hypothetical protein n=1 Tax=Vibrio gallaecicus TaxID=552386 RepID=UPI0010C970BA|nr:hypothetical protein [Vibrio gallaecicus]MDN3617265.1 hypothetical protein [Vibrio gallaecicus]